MHSSISVSAKIFCTEIDHEIRSSLLYRSPRKHFASFLSSLPFFIHFLFFLYSVTHAGAFDPSLLTCSYDVSHGEHSTGNIIATHLYITVRASLGVSIEHITSFLFLKSFLVYLILTSSLHPCRVLSTCTSQPLKILSHVTLKTLTSSLSSYTVFNRFFSSFLSLLVHLHLALQQISHPRPHPHRPQPTVYDMLRDIARYRLTAAEILVGEGVASDIAWVICIQ